MNIDGLKQLLCAVLVIVFSGASAAQAPRVTNPGFVFPADTAELNFQFTAASRGNFNATLYVVNVGDIVPAGYEVATITLEGELDEILTYTFTSPQDGWPAGIYRIVLSRNGQPVHQSDFHMFNANAAASPAGQPEPEPAPEASNTGVIVNGVMIDKLTLSQLEVNYGQVPKGAYWYDAVSGLYGLQDGPSLGQLQAGLALGGPLSANASGGGTSIYINGREIHLDEYTYLKNIYGQIFPGRYWLNADRVGGMEGQPQSFNLGADERARGLNSGGESVIMSSDGESSLATDSDGCQYFSSGSISASTC